MSNSPSNSTLNHPRVAPTVSYYIRKLLHQNLDRLEPGRTTEVGLTIDSFSDLNRVLKHLYPEPQRMATCIQNLDRLVFYHQELLNHGAQYDQEVDKIQQQIFEVLGLKQQALLPQTTILIVDDQVDNLRLLSTLLKTQDYEVCSAISGSTALVAVREALPDVILLDVNMPNMNGYEVCERLKADERTQDIPVIFLSAFSEGINKVKAFQVGGADYITKPFQVEEVLARIEYQIRLRRLQSQLSQKNAELQRQICERDRLLWEHEEAQQQLQKLNEELSRSNRDLEQFAYVVSHDLQQPLQSVTGFVALLLEMYGDSLNEDMVKYLKIIGDSGKHMQQFIQDVLTYSQAGALQVDTEMIDCQQILEQVAANLQVSIAERNAALIYESLPMVKANKTQLVQLFQNLISNAIKFVHASVSPQIRIVARQLESDYQFEIHDNGIGIDPQNCDRVFEVFQRLHPVGKFSGSGIGLATCKRIIETHQGHIWVESLPDVGTTVYFTLPINPAVR